VANSTGERSDDYYSLVFHVIEGQVGF